ncbi:MAG: type 4a pilus biogenesis protein PilO [Elusimicrobia bacterium]|nr:type 4a pilus biogenesis protein PilO [Elusimicrobiota bacterium]
MAKLEINKQSVENWLYENGFETGLKDKSLQAPLIVAVVGVFLGWFLIKSSTSKIATASALANDAQVKSQIAEEYRQVAVGWGEFSKTMFLPPDKDPKDWLSSQISSYAQGSGVEVIAANPSGEAVNTGSLIWQQGSFELRGSYHDLGRFMADLENSRPYVGVTDFSLKRDLSSEGNAKPSVRLTAYVFLSGAAAAKAAVP